MQREFDFRVIAHELGHTYGLFHANLWQVSDGNPISSSGVDTEYGDDFDTMGANYANSQATDFNPWFKNYLGWVADTQVLTVTTSGTYRVYAFDHDNYLAAPGETLGLQVVKDGTHNYWLGCRRDFTSNASMTNGVYVFWGYTYNRQSDLLDMTTPGNSDQDAGLAIGANFTDPATAITFHPLARGGVAPNEYRDIQVVFGTLPPLAPTISSEPASLTAVLGNAAVFPIRASGNPAPAFQWQRKPNGGSTWSVLSDGGNYSGPGTSNLTVTVADVAMNGDQFRCLVTNTAGSVTSSPPATLTVNSGLVITTLAGQAGNRRLCGRHRHQRAVFYPWNVATDRGGNVYVADYGYGMVREMTPAGVVSTLAPGIFWSGRRGGGCGVQCVCCGHFRPGHPKNHSRRPVTVLAGTLYTSGTNDGMNGSARFNSPWGIAVDGATNIYVADSEAAPSGKSPRWARTGWSPPLPDWPAAPGSNDGTNSQARFNVPGGLAVDAAHNLYVADTMNNTIRKITPDGTGTNWVVITLAGTAGIPGSRDGTGTNAQSSAQFYLPSGVAVDSTGNLYVADIYNDLIRKITPQGVVSTLAGLLFANASADGYYTNAQFNGPYGVAVDNAANIYVADTYNHTIRVGRLASITIPKLAVTLSNRVATVSWPVPIKNFNLQSSTNLLKTNWTS